MINTDLLASTASMAEKNCFDMTKLTFHIVCVTVVQWSRSFLHVQSNRVRLPATLLSVSMYCFFFLFGLFFLTLFFFLAFFFYSYCRPCWSCTWINIYFKLKSGVLFRKRDFKSSWSAYWPSFNYQIKTISCQDMSLLWNSWFFLMLVEIMTNTHGTPQTVLSYT